MKKYAFIFLLFTNLNAFAYDKGYHCHYLLDLVVYNQTSSECHLSQVTMERGAVYSKYLHTFIRASEVSQPYTFIVDGDAINEIDAGLSYQCGEDKFVTFHIKKTVMPPGYWSGYIENADGNIASLSNMEALFNIVPSRCRAAPAQIQTIELFLI